MIMIRGWVNKQKKSKKSLVKLKILFLAVFSAFAPVSAAFANDIDCSTFDQVSISSIDVDEDGNVELNGYIHDGNNGAAKNEYEEKSFAATSFGISVPKKGDSNIEEDSGMSSSDREIKVTKFEKQDDGRYYFEAEDEIQLASAVDISEVAYGGVGMKRKPFSMWSVGACILNKDADKATCDFRKGLIGIDSTGFAYGYEMDLMGNSDTTTCSGMALFRPIDVHIHSNIADRCLDEASGLFGWVSCPLLYTASDFITDIYTNVIEDWLLVEPQLFTRSGEGNNVYKAWSRFRDIANIAVVLLLLIIILSQITGFGISNYGIKKALPRLITAAILINLSYIVCQAAIDLSNIVGFGLKGILEGEMNAISQVTTASGSVTLGAGAVLFVAGLVALILVMIFVNPALLLFALAALIVALIAILFLFITMGIRQAMMILAVTVSPIAFACYVLPGTKSVYKKWFDLCKGLLLSYPIASLMVYGGALLGKIMAHVWGDSLLTFSSALVITVAPFFFIPRTITASLGAVNKVVDNIRNNITGRARNRLNRSGLGQDLRRAGDERRMQRWARMPGGAAYRRQADAINARHRRVQDYRNNPDMVRQEEALAKVRENESHIDSANETVQDMTANLNAALAADASDDNNALITAYTNKLKESSEGRAALANIFATRTAGPNALSDESFNAMMSSFGADEIDALREVSPHMATYIEGVKNGTIGRGDYNTINVFNSGMLDNLTEESVAKMDTAEFNEIVNQLTANPANNNSRQAVEFARIAERLANNEKLAPSLNSQKLDALTGTNGFLTQRNSRIRATAGSAFGAYNGMNSAQLNAQAQADYNAAAAAGDAERMEAVAYAYRNAAANRTNDAAVEAARTNIDSWANGARAAAQANGHQDVIGAQLDLISMPGHRIA